MPEGGVSRGVSAQPSAIPLIERLESALNAHDVEAVMDCIDPDYENEQPLHPDRAFRGTEQARENWAAIFRDVPDFQARVLRWTLQEDTLWAEWVWAGTQLDGSSLELRGVTLFGVREDQIIWERLYMEPVHGGSVRQLQGFLEAFNQHDVDAVMQYFADDAVFEMSRGPHPWGERLVGKAQVRAGVASRFAGIPNVHYGDEQHWVSGDRGVSEWTLRGTTPAGERVEVRGCDLFQFRGGKIVRKDSYWKLVE